MPSHLGSQPALKRPAVRLFSLLVLLLGSLIAGGGCRAQPSSLALLQDVILAQATATAVEFQQTMRALQSTQAGLQDTIAAAQISVQTQNSAAPPLTTPTPTETEAEPASTALEPSPAATPQAASLPLAGALPLTLDEQIQAAKILLYENMSGRAQVRYVKSAIEEAGYAYVDVGSAKGWLKTHLLSGEDWDLIIVAAEYRLPLDGEFLEYLHAEMEKGTAVILETWDLDASAQGKIGPILQACGAEYESDWFEPGQRSLWWLIPEHPIFHTPYEVGDSLRHYRTFWEGDLGDLLRASARGSQDGSPGQFLAGTMPSEKDNHAALLACYDGRVILQAFSSHEYAYNKITPLWKNYIYHTLKNRFAPAFAETAGSEHLAAPPSELPTEVAACGPALVGRILQKPEYAVDLFEHHAVGEYLIIELEITNNAGAPIQFWDDDYWVEAGVAGVTQRFNPAKEATTYLYNTRSGNWFQERIEPDQSLRMFLAFDVQPQAAGPMLVIQPGVEYGRPLCELRLELEE